MLLVYHPSRSQNQSEGKNENQKDERAETSKCMTVSTRQCSRGKLPGNGFAMHFPVMGGTHFVSILKASSRVVDQPRYSLGRKKTGRSFGLTGIIMV